MGPEGVSRREAFAASAALVTALPLAAQRAPGKLITAGEVIARIKSNVGIPWNDQTVDNLIAGNADTPVQGIATTMMATLDVMKRAAAAGKNMVITHEPTFYSHQDTIDQLKDDPVYRYKADFIRQQNMVCLSISTTTGTAVRRMGSHSEWHASSAGISIRTAATLAFSQSPRQRSHGSRRIFSHGSAFAPCECSATRSCRSGE